MKQEAFNHSDNILSSASFRQKITALALLMTIAVTFYYFVNVWTMQPIAVANNIIPAGYDSLVWNVGRLFILSQFVWYVLLTLAAASPEKTAALKASRNAHIVLTLGIFAVVASFFWGELIPFYTVDLAVISFALSEIVKFASQLFYTRR